MIWHFFKKDWKLLWPFVALVAGIHVLNAATWLMLGVFGEPRELRQIAQLMPLAVLLGIGVLIVTALHQDPIPGDRQDWLVRPIRRRDLLLAKLLFVLAAVHGPMLLVDLVQSLAAGFSVWASLAVALSRGTLVMLNFSLPLLAIATITSTLVEAIGAFLAISLALFVLLVATAGISPPLNAGGMGWMMVMIWSAVALAVAAIVIPVQFFRRATTQTRALVLGAAILLPLPLALPWAPAFSLEQRLSANPAIAKPVAVAFDPDFGKLTLERGGRTRANSLWLPLSVSGLAPGSILISDRANIRIIGRDDTVLYSGPTTGDPSVTGDPGAGPLHIVDFPVRTTTGGNVRTHQLITLPGKIYARVHGQPVRVELDYSLTLYHIEVSDMIAARDGDKWIAGFGRCKARMDNDDVEIGCFNIDEIPECVTLVLENAATGQRNPPYNICPPEDRPDYTPYEAHFFPGAVQRFGSRLIFRDPQGLAKYPVDSSQLANARISIKTYEPVAHFTRHLTIPEIRLGDWEAETRQIAASTAPPQ